MLYEVITTQASATSDGEGDFTVPARKLLDITKALPEGAVINIEVNGDKAKLQSARSRFSLGVLPAQDYPVIEPTPSNMVFTVNEGFVITSYSIHYTKLYEIVKYLVACTQLGDFIGIFGKFVQKIVGFAQHIGLQGRFGNIPSHKALSPPRLQCTGSIARLFPDAETGEDSPQQIVRSELAGNLREGLLRLAEILRQQFAGLMSRQHLLTLEKRGTSPFQRIQMTTPRDELAFGGRGA